MNNYPAILLYIKKTKADKMGKCKIYLRLTINGKRAECSVNRKVSLAAWNSSASKVNGNTPEAYSINAYLSRVRTELDKHFHQLLSEGQEVTAMMLRDKFLGRDKKQKMLLEIFKEHNEKIERLVGQEYAAGTAERYRTTYKHIQEYLKKEYHLNDIDVNNVDHFFISGFEYYLKTERRCGHNSAVKYVTNFKKIIRHAHANGWIEKDPFIHWKAQLKTVDREFLTTKELQLLVEARTSIPRLDLVKDIFLFSCFTGLAYIDVKKLSKNDLVIGMDGAKWVKTFRTKTNTRSNIPLLPTAELILEKYSSHPEIVNSEKLLPILTNQKMNAYLKEIADLAGIKKNLTFHLARHTFATTVTLTNGVSIESVSKMLGHKSLRTTQHYAKILDQKVSEDMQALKNRLAGEV